MGRGRVTDNDGKKMCWDRKHKIRMNCTARRPDVTFEDNEKESNKEEKRTEKIGRYEHRCLN